MSSSTSSNSNNNSKGWFNNIFNFCSKNVKKIAILSSVTGILLFSSRYIYLKKKKETLHNNVNENSADIQRDNTNETLNLTDSSPISTPIQHNTYPITERIEEKKKIRTNNKS